MAQFKPTKNEIAALVLGLAAFVVYFGDSSTTTVNGRVTESHDYNYAGVVLGVIAISIVAKEAFRIARGQLRDLAGPPAAHYAIIAAIALLGLYQFVHGIDLV